MSRVAFLTLGCKVNQFDSDISEGLFRQRGYQVVDFDADADVYVINTCVVTNVGESKSRQMIHRAVRRNPNACIVVAGCYAQISPDEVAKLDGVNVVIGNQDRHSIVDLVEKVLSEKITVNAVTDIRQASEFEDIPLFYPAQRTRAFLKIQEGCTNYCTYCIIPYVRGTLRSRTTESIMTEIGSLVQAGFGEVVLTGIHLGAYGVDLGAGASLSNAVAACLSVGGLTRLRLGSLESIEVDDVLINMMSQDQRLCRQLHLPLQSANNDVLHTMNRSYTVEQFYDLVKKIRISIPDIAITTDVIVGFPGETTEMFEESLLMIEKIGFARIHVFPYSRREGTPAAKFPNQVIASEKKRRARKLGELAKVQANQFIEKFLGTEMKVLFESENNGVIDGLTGNYIRVYIAGESILLGDVGIVKLQKLYREGVWGELQ